MTHTDATDLRDRSLGSAAEFFALMAELPGQLSQIGDREKIELIAGTLENIWSSVCQQLGMNEHRVLSSKHRPRWEQVPYMSTRTATRADRLTEVSQQPAQYATSADTSDVERTFGSAAQILLDSLREVGVYGRPMLTPIQPGLTAPISGAV